MVKYHLQIIRSKNEYLAIRPSGDQRNSELTITNIVSRRDLKGNKPLSPPGYSTFHPERVSLAITFSFVKLGISKAVKDRTNLRDGMNDKMFSKQTMQQ